MIKLNILLATTNEGKVQEIKELFKNYRVKDIDFITLKDLPKVDEPIEDGKTFFENAYIKATYYYNIFKIPTITDDSGLLVKALKNEPGVNTARYACENGEKPNSVKNYNKLLNNLKGVKERQACFKTSMLFYDGKIFISSEGKMYGTIAEEPRGNNGFGYDPVFIVPKYNKTVGELTEEEKNKISHRSKAVKSLVQKLKVYF